MVWLYGSIPFLGIFLLCQRTPALLNPPQYHLISSPLTWHEAQHFCRVKYTDLATVNNMFNKNRLVNMLSSRVTSSWIGLHRGGVRRWMWSDGQGGAKFTKWTDGEPNNNAGKEWCGELSQTGLWNDLPCEEEKGFVCYERDHGGQDKYVYYSEKKNWVTSLELCRSRHTDMAYVNTEAANSEVANLVKTWTGLIWLPNKVWFGLFCDTWLWSDGSKTSFRFWQSGTQSGGNCASISVSHHGRWVDAYCNEKAAFVCQGGLKVKKMVLRMKIRSDVKFTNSAVSDALLKELETSLKLQRLTDFSLSWRRDKHGIIFQRHEQLKIAEKTGC